MEHFNQYESMKICFIMYPWERVNPAQDSTLRIIHEAVKRGHDVAISHPSNLTIRDSITLSLCKNITSETKFTTSIPAFYKKCQVSNRNETIE